MNSYYKVLDKLKELLLEDPDVNTVTRGTPEEIDTYKATMFPLVHLAIEPSRFTTNTVVFVFRINALNQREKIKEPTLDKFSQNDNQDDNLNAMFYVLARLYLRLFKFGDDLTIVNEPLPEPRIYAFSNLLDGWEMVLEIEAPLDPDNTNFGGC